MARYIFLMECKPGSEEEYKKRHQNVYPELLQAFKDIGIESYSIFMDGNKLFAFMEVDDFNKAMDQLEDHPANVRWQSFMSDILVQENDSPKMKVISEEVFYLS